MGTLNQFIPFKRIRPDLTSLRRHIHTCQPVVLYPIGRPLRLRLETQPHDRVCDKSTDWNDIVAELDTRAVSVSLSSPPSPILDIAFYTKHLHFYGHTHRIDTRDPHRSRTSSGRPPIRPLEASPAPSGFQTFFLNGHQASFVTLPIIRVQTGLGTELIN